MEMTKEKLEAAYPELIKEITDAAYQSGHTTGKEEGLTEGQGKGSEAERTRIQEVKAQLLPGHEALIEELMFDGKTSGAEAAGRIVAAEKEVRAVALKSLEADAKATEKVAASEGTEPPAKKMTREEHDKLAAEGKGNEIKSFLEAGGAIEDERK